MGFGSKSSGFSLLLYDDKQGGNHKLLKYILVVRFLFLEMHPFEVKSSKVGNCRDQGSRSHGGSHVAYVLLKES